MTGFNVICSLICLLATAQQSCAYKVDEAGMDDYISTMDIWEAMTALDFMCAHKGMVGTAYALGT